jgi:DNA-binding NarL/FixJ family response regulator
MRWGSTLGSRWDALLSIDDSDHAAAAAAAAASIGAASSMDGAALIEAVKAALAARPFVPSHVTNHMFLLNLAQVPACPRRDV